MGRTGIKRQRLVVVIEVVSIVMIVAIDAIVVVELNGSRSTPSGVVVAVVVVERVFASRCPGGPLRVDDVARHRWQWRYLQGLARRRHRRQLVFDEY